MEVRTAYPKPTKTYIKQTKSTYVKITHSVCFYHICKKCVF